MPIIYFPSLYFFQLKRLQLEHSKEYKNKADEALRMEIFTENLDKIAEHNLRYDNKKVSFKLAMNKFGDLTHHEFVARLNCYNRSMGLK